MLIRKLARGRLLRRILALRAWTSNGSRSTTQVDDQDGRGGAQLTKRTRITVETERVLVVRAERRSFETLSSGSQSDIKSPEQFNQHSNPKRNRS
jgi:hypothetical protein